MTLLDTDARRRVIGVSGGAARFLNEAQASYDDVLGAVESQDWELAAFEARVLVSTCLSIQSLQRGGEPFAFFGDLATFDPYEGLAADAVFVGHALAARGLSMTAEDAPTWVAELRTLMHETEACLGLPEPLPELRAPDGMFTVMRMARDWLSAIDAWRLPPILPEEWTGDTEERR